QTENSAKPLVLAREQVSEVVRERGPLDEYVVERDTVSATAQAHYDLGIWCEVHKLSGPAEVHFQKALELDTGFGPAHKKLGHVERGGKWFTFDQLRQAQGLVLYKGRWMTREERDRSDAKVAVNTEQVSWGRRIKLLRAAVLSGSDEQRQIAEV